mmetsp:Transcript_57001/g.133689  ORF Transcript_57001/g.133689 Transcript_57001/m.133689 type:complete len:368 (-) Transcript_57001:840-1943(-)
MFILSLGVVHGRRRPSDELPDVAPGDLHLGGERGLEELDRGGLLLEVREQHLLVHRQQLRPLGSSHDVEANLACAEERTETEDGARLAGVEVGGLVDVGGAFAQHLEARALGPSGEDRLEGRDAALPDRGLEVAHHRQQRERRAAPLHRLQLPHRRHARAAGHAIQRLLRAAAGELGRALGVEPPLSVSTDALDSVAHVREGLQHLVEALLRQHHQLRVLCHPDVCHPLRRVHERDLPEELAAPTVAQHLAIHRHLAVARLHEKHPLANSARDDERLAALDEDWLHEPLESVEEVDVVLRRRENACVTHRLEKSRHQRPMLRHDDSALRVQFSGLALLEDFELCLQAFHREKHALDDFLRGRTDIEG